MRSIRSLLLVGILFSMITGCESLSGDLNENQPPSTNLTVQSINRGDEFRLSSQINISWFGNDPDGYVVGFEYAINDTSEDAWTFTTRSDSTFILPISLGSSTDDVLFKIRAVDNDNARDPVGASLVYPIVNTSPTVSINQNESPPDTLFSVSSIGWTISDQDGLLNLQSTEIALNDTSTWTSIPFDRQGDGSVFISLEVDNSSIGTTEADLFQGRAYTRILNEQNDPVTLSGINVGDMNTFYVRTTDAAGAVSNVDTVSWYIKPQLSRVLFLNDDGTSNFLNKQAAHLNYLNNNGISPDIWLINTGEVEQSKIALSEQFPAIIDPTLRKTLAKWDHIYWISNDIDRNITYALDITTEFFENGGSMFVNIPMKRISQTDEILNFLPVDSIGVLTTGRSDFVINGNTDVTPLNNVTTTTPRTSGRQTSVYPLKAVSGSTPLYQTDFRTTTVLGTIIDYTGPEQVVIQNNEGNLIYLSLDLTTIGANGNLSELIEFLTIERLGFSN